MTERFTPGLKEDIARNRLAEIIFSWVCINDRCEYKFRRESHCKTPDVKPCGNACSCWSEAKAMVKEIVQEFEMRALKRKR